MKYSINGKQFTYVFDYKENNILRNSFNNLTRRVYGFDFENWYQSGYWTGKYIPSSLLYDDKVVANVSVNPIDFCLFDHKKKYVQIGTVMTDPDFRDLGLSRFLMEQIMMTWRDRCDMMYLFANDSVLNYYPKFNFEEVKEYQYLRRIHCKNSKPAAKKVDMDENSNQLLFAHKVNKAKDIADLSMRDNIGLVMFYCTAFMKNNIYYIAEYDAYVVAEFSDDILYLQDYFCESDISAEEIVAKMSSNSIKNVVLGFTPKSKTNFEINLLKQKDVSLFVCENDRKHFQQNKIMFPIISHA